MRATEPGQTAEPAPGFWLEPVFAGWLGLSFVDWFAGALAVLSLLG